jgi:hypothetical protein
MNPDLKESLATISRIFDLDSLLDADVDSRFITKYYIDSNLGYRWFHSADGSIHMALNYDGSFAIAGYYGQAELVAHHIEELRPEFVLELASGQGFNSLYLAKKYPEV